MKYITLLLILRINFYLYINIEIFLYLMGGLSILGTTGIVRPISAKAWTDTMITCSSSGNAAILPISLFAKRGWQGKCVL